MMADDDTFGPADIEPPDKARKGGKLPPLPDRDAPFSAVRHWVSDAIGLPPTVRVETVVRYGRLDDDSLAISLSNDVVIRCDRQKRLQAPGTFQAFFASESDGLCQPKYYRRDEVGDVFIALCRLGTADTAASELEAFSERLDMFVGMCDKFPASLRPPERYSTISKLRARPTYDPKYNGIDPHPPVLVVDEGWGKRFIRHTELVGYLRVIHGQTVDERVMPGRMREVGGDRHNLQAWAPDRSQKIHLVFYELPPEG
jgi:hypothetical protein